MIYLRNKNNGAKKTVLMGVFIVLFLILIIAGPARRFSANLALFLAEPFLKQSDSLKNWLSEKGYSFESRENLAKENIELKNKLHELETKLLLYEVLEKENADMKEILGRHDKERFTAGYILSRPSVSPYDVLVVDVGSEAGIEKGMAATVYGDIVIGYIEEVFAKNSKIKLISFPKNETNAVALSSNIPVAAIGKGGGNMEIILPKDAEIKEGERIVTMGGEPMLVGIVEKIQSDESDPFQKLLLRIPVNLQELRYVMIKL